jgi:signal transduction histidine kinase
VELSVSDQCGGISENDMERVFDLAWRGGAARTPDRAEELAGVAGAGLGLAIVRGIVEAHRGVVRVENRAPVGCQFFVRLPG